MREVLILVLMLIFLSPGPVCATSIESVPDSETYGGDLIAAVTAPSLTPAKIPDAPVHMFIRQGADSRFELFFIDVRYGYDVVDFEFYKAWCLLKDKPIRRNVIHKIRLYNCYDPDLPSELRGTGWEQINYIINHKKGTKEQIQEAIWHFTNGPKPSNLSEGAEQLIREAKLNGGNYKPAENELMAIVCVSEGEKQPVFIEFKIPEAVTFDVASATFVPPAISGAGVLPPAWLPLLPLASVPLVPLSKESEPLPVPQVTPVSPNPAPGPHNVGEPSSLLLLASGMACMLTVTIRKRIKRPCM